MSDRWLNKQHDEVKTRNRQKREAAMTEAAKISAANNRRHGR
jgi:hypothetical protein